MTYPLVFEFGFLSSPFLSRPGGHGELGSTPARRAARRASASGFARAARLWLFPKSKRRDFGPLLKKQPLASRAGTHSPLGAPPGAGQKRRNKNVRGNQNP